MRLSSRSGLGRRRHVTILAVLMAIALIVPAAALAHHKPGHPKPGPVTIQFLAVSDWHAQLDNSGSVGGAAVLATYWQAERAANPNTLTLTAGDAYGASPPLSGFFEEVPAVKAMRLMGFDVDTFGNHNFDAGVDHLQDMVDLVNASAGAQPGQPFRYVAANLKNRDAELDGVTDWHVFDVGGIKVGVVGLVNEEAPTLVFPGNFGAIEVTDSVRAANKARVEMQRAGAQVLVAITHKGIRGFDGDGNAHGELIDFANSVGGFDLIFGDHTDFQYSGFHGKALVSENRSKGATYSKTVVTVDPTNGQVKSKSVQFITPTHAGVTPDPAIEAMLQPYRDQLAPIMNTVLGYSDKTVPRSDSCGRSDGRLCESLIGNIVTDAMRTRYEADFAITNSGGLRDALTCAGTTTAGFCPIFTPPPYAITRGRTFTVLPFGNFAMTLSINGAELKELLEFGVSAMPSPVGIFQQVSGLCFTYDVQAPTGSRVTSAVRQAASGACTGPAVSFESSVTYDIVENDFMVAGGEGHPFWIDRSSSDGTTLEQVLAEYVGQFPSTAPMSPTIQGRIVCTDSNLGAAPACPATLP